jgi:hypothetical protein
MYLRVRVRLAVVLCATFFTLASCRAGGDGARGRAAAPAGPPPEVVKPMLVSPSPYYLIYSPPVSLAKPPDTTAHGRKPRS